MSRAQDIEPVTITIPGEPVAWQRAGRNGKQTYTPAKTKNYETAIAMSAVSAMMGRKPFPGPVSVRVTAYFSIPDSWPKWKREAALQGAIRHTGKPDFDNVCKLVDGITRSGRVWNDDSYVCAASIAKEYSTDPRLEILISPAPGLPSQVATQEEMRAAS